jgi:hypothetical protein
LITWFRGYLVIVSREPKVESQEQVLDRTVLHDDLPPGTILTIYDLKGKFVAFKDDFGKRAFHPLVGKAVGEPIKHVLLDGNDLVIITSERNVRTLVLISSSTLELEKWT